MNKAELLKTANSLNKNTLMETLGIEFTEIGEGTVKATMTVDSKVHQPMGLLHGGASVALAESVGSVGSALMLDMKKQSAVGLEINANHLRGIKSGTVTANASILHKGRKTHVWEIKIHDEQDKLICICRLTNMIIDI